MDELNIVDKINYNMYIKPDSEGYRYIGDYSEGMFSTMHINGVCGYINESGYETLLFDYALTEDFHDGLALVQKPNGLYGYIDKDFNEVVPCIYLYCSRFYNGYSIVKDNYKDKIIDKNGTVIKELEEEANFEEVLNILYKNKLLSKDLYNKYADTTGSAKIKKVAKTTVIGTKVYSYYNEENNRIIPFDNIDDRDFKNDFIVINLGHNTFKIFNKKGKELKIHSCLGVNVTSNPNFMNRAIGIKYKISCIENDGYASLITYKGKEYVLIARTLEELNKKKEEFFSLIPDVKAHSKI